MKRRPEEPPADHRRPEGRSTTPVVARLSFWAQPRAPRTEVVGRHGDAIKIKLAAPPVDGAANDALVRFLADALGVPRGAVTLVAGAAARSKVVRIEGLTRDEAERRLLAGSAAG